MSKINRNELVDFVDYYLSRHQRRPKADEIAKRFGCSASFAARETKAMFDDPDFFRDARRDEVDASRAETAKLALKFIDEYVATHGWAPSQREVAAAIGCSIEHANTTLNRLEDDGLIVKGPHPRQIRLVNMKAPEVAL
jgi:DNA-directed RNA polymerase specialized sigma subunit